MGYGHPFFGGFGILFVVVYVAVVAYALYLLTRIADYLKDIAVSLERLSAGKPPPENR